MAEMVRWHDSRDGAALRRLLPGSCPSTDAGIFARYQEASLDVSLGNTADAVKAYQSVIDHAGDVIYGQMAKLGLAEAYARGGQGGRGRAVSLGW